jgi:integrase
MAAIERRQRTRRGPVHWRVRWRDAEDRQRSKTFETHADAKRYKLRLEGDVAAGTWIDPANARIPLGEFVVEWRKSIVDLRPTSLARMESAVRNQILPEWGTTALSGIANADVRAWAAQLHASGYSASTVRKAVFTLRRILDAAVADRRLAINAADKVPLPVEEPGEQRFLTAEEVEVLADTIAPRFRAMVLVAAYGGLRFGELTGLRRERVDVLRGRVQVAETLVQVGADLSFGPTKTRNGRRTVPLPRRVMGELARHMERYVPPPAEELVFTGLRSQPLRREWFRRTWWLPAVRATGLDGLRFHDLRHTYVSLLIRAGANAKEVSTWAGHSTVAFTLDRYGHLYDDADDSMPDRLDALLNAQRPASNALVLPLPDVSERTR